MTTPGVAPKIVIDARMITPKPHGFARYTRFLAEGLAEVASRGPLPYQPIFLVDRGLPPPKLPPAFETVSLASAFLGPFEMIEIPRTLRDLGARLYHSPTFSSLPRCPVPWIVTIHDLNHLSFGGLKEKAYYRLLLKRFARGAQELLTVSKASRKELAEWSGVAESKIDVVYNALDPALSAPIAEADARAVLDKYGLRHRRYFFCLSNPKPHKNVEMLLGAYRNFVAEAEERDSWPLVLSMGEMRTLKRTVWLGELDEHEARCLLGCAGALVFPSLYEGFGLPPVEAAAVGGIPLLVSRIPAHVEALQDVPEKEVCWLDPLDETAWTRAMLRASLGEVPGVTAASAGRVRARYTVGNLGAHMDRVYRRVLQRMEQ